MAQVPKSNSYLAKLLTLLIKREKGVIRIPAADLMGDDKGQGFSVHFDQSSKELVLSFVQQGTTVYTIEEPTTWLTSEALPQNRQASRPLSQEELVLERWTGSSATPTVEETLRPQSPKNRVVQITPETQVAAETERLKASLLREIEGFQSPQPPAPPMDRHRTHSPQVRVSSKP